MAIGVSNADDSFESLYVNSRSEGFGEEVKKNFNRYVCIIFWILWMHIIKKHSR